MQNEKINIDTTAVETNREKSFDILKGIGIILMVLGHSFASPNGNFFKLFHMAIFFICSGVFFKEKHYKNRENIIKFIKSKIKHLYIPFILWNGFLTLIHNFLLKVNIYTNDTNFLLLNYGAKYGLTNYYSIKEFIFKLIYTLLFVHQEQLGGATWFLRVLFWISIVTVVGHYLLKKIIKNNLLFTIITIILYTIALCIGFLLQKTDFNFYSIGVMFTCSILYYLGVLYKKYKEKINIRLLGFIISLLILIISYHFVAGQIDLSSNKYPNPIWLLIASCSGFIFILSISDFIKKFSVPANILSYIGQHTISILLFHIAAFKIITYIQVLKYSKPDYCLAAFPTLIYDGGWWIVYTLFGVFVPILLSYFWDNIKKIMIKGKNN